MISFLWILEQIKLTYADSSQINGCLEEGIDYKWYREIFEAYVKIPYFESGSGSSSIKFIELYN